MEPGGKVRPVPEKPVEKACDLQQIGLQLYLNLPKHIPNLPKTWFQTTLKPKVTRSVCQYRILG